MERIIEGHTCDLETFGMSEKADFCASDMKLLQKPGLLGVTYHLSGLSLIHIYRRDNLSHNRTGYLETLRAFNQFAVHHGAVIQHVLNINQTAVKNRLNKIVRIMEVQHALLSLIHI